MPLNTKKQQGVAMMEVLIAIVVIAFGFMALLKLQLSTLNNVTASNQRYIAASLAHSMGDMLRVNAANRDSYNGADTNVFSKDCSSSTCSLYENDMYEWKRSINDAAQALPEGRGTILVNAGRAVISLYWKEKRSIHNVENASFQLEVQVE